MLFKPSSVTVFIGILSLGLFAIGVASFVFVLARNPPGVPPRLGARGLRRAQALKALHAPPQGGTHCGGLEAAKRSADAERGRPLHGALRRDRYRLQLHHVGIEKGGAEDRGGPRGEAVA